MMFDEYCPRQEWQFKISAPRLDPNRDKGPLELEASPRLDAIWLAKGPEDAHWHFHTPYTANYHMYPNCTYTINLQTPTYPHPQIPLYPAWQAADDP